MTSPGLVIVIMEVPLVQHGLRWNDIEQIYWYYYHRGFRWVLVSQVYHIVGYIFIYLLLIMGLFFIDWRYLGSVRDLTSIFTSNNDMLWFKRFSIIVAMISFIIMCFRIIQSMVIIITYYRTSKLIDRYNIDINRPWSEVVTRLVSISDTNILEIHQLVMRKDNIVLSFFHQLYPMVIPSWYTIAFEWILDASIWSYLINLDRPIIRVDHVKSTLRRRIIICGWLYLISSPFVMIYVIGYYVVNYLEQIRQHPLWLFQRRWNRLAYCRLRYYNELLHLFERRLEGSQDNVEIILRSTPPNVILVLISRIIRLVSGTLLTILLIIGVINSDIITSSTIYGYPLLSLIGLLGLVFFLPDWVGKSVKTHYIQDIDDNLRIVNEKIGINSVDMIRLMYQYRVIVFIVEVIGIILSPIYLLVKFRKLTDDILNFFINHTKFIDRFGRYFCVDSSFRSVDMDNSDDKIYRSVLTFSNNNPDWK
jgi:autophagy-related protein 9